MRVVGKISQMDSIRNFFGDEMKKVEYGNIFSIFLGICAGLIPFSIGKIIFLAVVGIHAGSEVVDAMREQCCPN